MIRRTHYATFAIADIFFVLIMLAGTAFSLFILLKEPVAKKKVAVYKGMEKIGSYELPATKEVTVQGRLGAMIIELDHDRVRVCRSLCKNKICIRTGWISEPGQQIVCVPNQIIIVIKAIHNGKSPDAYSR